MGTEFLPIDYLTVLKEDIPNGRDDLISTSKSLEDVAVHCLNTYDKSLEQTVNYTAQALGSVAYKINLLATRFLEVLDYQNLKLNELQTKVNHLNMQVHIHQEKTARLSIGKYTMPRDPNVMRPSKNIEPLLEMNSKYKRKEIDFTVLDHIGHGVKEPQLGGSIAMFSTNSRRSSTSGSDTLSSSHAYTQSSLGGSVGPKIGSEYSNKFGKIQTIGRNTGVNINNPGGTIYRAPGSLAQKSQIPMASPNLSSGGGGASGGVTASTSNYGNTVQYQQQMSQTGARRTGSVSTASSGVSQIPQQQPPQPQPQQQKIYQSTSNVVSPHKMSVGSIPGNIAPNSVYGYSGVNHHMTHVPPPPPPMLANQPSDQSMSPIMRYNNELPPPPLEPPSPYQQQNMTVLPPPPTVQQFQLPPTNDQANNSDRNQNRYMADTVGIAHLQPNPFDVLRIKNSSDEMWAPAQYICKVITLYEYQQNKDDELSFIENELIYVVKKNNDGWWEGVMNGRTGLFPGNYVQNVN